jgi:hypothetical protein
MELLRTQIAVLLFFLKDQYIPGLTGQRKAGIRPLGRISFREAR